MKKHKSLSMNIFNKIYWKIYYRVVQILILPLEVYYFFDKKIGRHYKLGVLEKIRLIRKFRRNVRKINTASSWQEHLQMAAKILQIPPDVRGDIIECGSFKGGSTANLSLVCSIVKKKLLVYDSFEGLPEPSKKDKKHYSIFSRRRDNYEKGQYIGSLEEVKKNIEKYGCINVCKFNKGYFENTLPKLKNSIAFGFLDVDLYDSLKTCLTYLWPQLQKNCFLFSHEAMDLPYVSLFFDEEWWKSKFKCEAPGFIGAGTGLPLFITKGVVVDIQSKGEVVI